MPSQSLPIPYFIVFFFQAEDGIRDWSVTGVQTCALPIWKGKACAKAAFTSSQRVYNRLVRTAASWGCCPRSRLENERSRHLQGPQNSRHRKRNQPPDRKNPEASSCLPARTGASESRHRSEFG